MKWRKWLENWDMTSLKISAPFLEMEWNPAEPDKDAAWELYVELLTRITTQPLPDEDGDEETALQSVYALFGLTRSIIKSHGRDCREFTKIAIVVLNQIIRPFTAKWHKVSVAGQFNNPDICNKRNRGQFSYCNISATDVDYGLWQDPCVLNFVAPFIT